MISLRRIGSSAIPANLVGAVVVFLYFTYVDPLTSAVGIDRVHPFALFVVVAGTLIFTNGYFGQRWLRPLFVWRRRIEAGEAAAHEIPEAIRRRALNAPLVNAVLSMAGFTIAGIFYFVYLSWFVGVDVAESAGIFGGIVLVGGVVTSALAFLLSEFHWRQEVPVFFPDGRIPREGVLRVPVLVRLGGTFFITSVFPLVLVLIVGFGLEARFGETLPPPLGSLWMGLLRVQLFIIMVTGLASIAMAFLVARFINRPVQALRTAMARVAGDDLNARVPVRSADELGELNNHFNAMVEELRRGERMRELFGRYVSPAVARQALERGIALGGEVVRATAMFVDLRGFTVLTQRTPAARVVEVLNEYYATVERICEREGGIITQFLGDGVVVVFGAPLRPLPDHAQRAVHAAVELQRAFAERNRGGREPRIEAGIGICTGDMIAGNVGAGERVTYTIVGDAVNKAARLQVMTRDLGASILLTESTRAALGESDGLVLRARGPVSLQGIFTPVEVYSVEA